MVNELHWFFYELEIVRELYRQLSQPTTTVDEKLGNLKLYFGEIWIFLTWYKFDFCFVEMVPYCLCDKRGAQEYENVSVLDEGNLGYYKTAC